MTQPSKCFTIAHPFSWIIFTEYGTMIVLLLLFATCICFIVKIYKERREYFKTRGIPGPEPKLFTGHVVRLYEKDNPCSFKLREWTKKYGKVYGILEGFQRVLVISDLDMLQEIFQKKFDEFYGRKPAVFEGDIENDSRIHLFLSRGVRWKRLRSLASPAFSVNSLKKVRPIIEDSVKNFLRHLEKYVDGGAFNLNDHIYELTFDVILRVAMGQKSSVQFNNPLISQAVRIFGSEPMNSKLYVFLAMLPRNRTIARIIRWLSYVLDTFKTDRVVKMIEKAVQQRMKDRENGVASVQTDFIDLFLDAKIDFVDDPEVFSKNNLKVQRAMNYEEVLAQCFVFLLAGFDTTANAIASVMYFLAKNTKAKQKLMDEADVHCTEEEISMETISNMRYLDCVVKESLRLNPLASITLHRECQKDTEICGMKIEKGVSIWADVWSIHYDKTIWGDDADEFRPERFESSERRHPMSFFPFGEGPRKCVGMRMGYLETKLTLAHFFRTYDLLAAPNTQENMKFIGAFTTRPAVLDVCLKRRS